MGILGSGNPEKGLALLAEAGFVTEVWPELAAMAGIPHGKDFHPEGNVWEHTLATLTYRKRPDLVLSLALLLHDSGKPDAEGAGGEALRRARGDRRQDQCALPAPTRLSRRAHRGG